MEERSSLILETCKVIGAFYGGMAFLFFTFFLFMGMLLEMPKSKTIKNYTLFDHFWLSVGMALTWPYGAYLVVTRKHTDGDEG